MVDSGTGTLDLFVQTMYVNVKKGIANAVGASTSTFTSETTVGTTLNNSMPSYADSVNRSE